MTRAMSKPLLAVLLLCGAMGCGKPPVDVPARDGSTPIPCSKPDANGAIACDFTPCDPERILIGPDGHGKYWCHLPQTGGRS